MNDKPKFYRQVVLLSILRILGEHIKKTDLQKHTFLLSQLHPTGYEFIPYKFGCYSFQLNKDLENIIDRGLVTNKSHHIELTTVNNPLTWLKEIDRLALLKYPKEIKKLRNKELVKYVYERYHYYAINSTIVKKVCNKDTQQEIHSKKIQQTNQNSTVYTIGYEGISLENYINKLINNNIRLLCDVRRNPLSRKFGFSRRTLEYILPRIGIKYIHFPELGVISSDRKKLNNHADYNLLFTQYKTQLINKEDSLNSILYLHKKYQRIALTCFERSHQQCHRHCISDHLHHKHSIDIHHL